VNDVYFPPENETIQADALPEYLQSSLRELLRKFEETSDIARREYVRKVLKNRELFRGNAWRWFDYQTGAWRAYNSMSGGMSTVSGGVDTQSLYALNFFQGYALSLIALLSGNKMVVKFWPQNSRKPEDVEAAKKCDAVVRWFRTQEKTHSQLVKAIYLLWTDGTFGSYVRTVADGERFGWIEEPQIEMQERVLAPAGYTCPVCKTVNEGNIGCQNCGAPLNEQADIPAQTASVPIQVGSRTIPRSKTIRDIVDGLEMLTPPTANDIHEFEYLIRRREMTKATVRHAFKHVANKIGTPGGTQAGDSATSTIEKRARLQMSHGLTADNRPTPVRSSEYITVSEIWFAKRAFYQLDDERKREELLQAFPDGAYVAFADDVFCEARNENLLDHWSVCHALPGTGQIREPIGGSLVQIQEVANDVFNMVRDNVEYTLPVTFVDSQVLDLKKWARSSVMAGAAYNAKAPPGQSLANGFFQTAPGQLPEYAVNFLNDLRTSIAQFVTGVFPAAYGAHGAGNSTAQGMEIERNSALGRVSLFLRALCEHWSEVAELVVKDFKKNATEPIDVVSVDQSGSYRTETLGPNDLDIGLARTYPELDEDYPTTWPQKQALLMQLMGNPLFQPMMTMMSNADMIKKTLGHELQVPGEAQYRRAFKIFQQLLAQQPIPQPPQPAMDPMTGQPILDMTGMPIMQPMPPLPSIQPDLLDDAAINITAAVDFAFSEDGELAKQANPVGWQNLMLWVEANHAKLISGQGNPLAIPPPMPAPGQAPPQ